MDVDDAHFCPNCWACLQGSRPGSAGSVSPPGGPAVKRAPVPNFARLHSQWSASLARARSQRRLTLPKVGIAGLGATDGCVRAQSERPLGILKLLFENGTQAFKLTAYEEHASAQAKGNGVYEAWAAVQVRALLDCLKFVQTCLLPTISTATSPTAVP